MKETKQYLLTLAITVLMTATFDMLNNISYKESIYDNLWIAVLINTITYFISYYIAKNLLKNNK